MPATITVTTLGDSGAGSLREAIEQANLDAAPDTIVFAPEVVGKITLATSLPVLSTNLTLEGPGASGLSVVDPGETGFSVIRVAAGAEVGISGLTITGGRPSREVDPIIRRVLLAGGSGISNFGTLTVTDSAIVDNKAEVAGGIENAGTMRISGTTVADNEALGSTIDRRGRGSGQGGGILNSGTLTVNNSSIRGNSAAYGGGLTNLGTVVVANAIIADNRGSFGIGIDNARGTLSVVASTISGNRGVVGNNLDATGGAGIANEAKADVTSSTIVGNAATRSGGGIANSAGGTFTLSRSTVVGNSANSGGGVVNSGTLNVTNSTICGNSASVLIDGGGNGGGIANFGALTVSRSTIAGNAALRGGGVAGALDGSAVTISSSLFAGNSGGSLDLTGGAFASLGHNLFSDAPGVALDPTDLINSDPLLGPLADNGGPTLTHALLPGSPAIDAGAPADGPTTDQRGVARPQGGSPDIGAFESRGFTMSIAQGDGQAVPAGSAFPFSLVVTLSSAFGEPVAGGRVAFVAPDSGASAVPTLSFATIDADGLAAVRIVANGLAGSYAISAQATGANAVTFALANLEDAPIVVEDAPMVLSLKRSGIRARRTRLVLSFSGPLESVRAQDRGNYRLVDRKRPGRTIPIRSATYDPTGRSVTLNVSRRLPPRHTFQLTIRGTPPGGLTSPTGTHLNGGGHPGSDHVRRFGQSVRMA